MKLASASSRLQHTSEIISLSYVPIALWLLARTLDRGLAEKCGLETPVAAGSEDQVCAFLDHPDVCPHGRPIAPGAPGSCCSARDETAVSSPVEAADA